MANLMKRYHAPGTPPGTLDNRDHPVETPVRLHMMDTSGGHLDELEDASLEACAPALASMDSVTWIHVQGRPGAALLKDIGDCFGLHQLAMEDIINTGQRPKLDQYDAQLFLILAHPWIQPEPQEDELQTAGGRLKIDQISIFHGQRFVVSFCETPSDPFEPVRKRLRGSAGRFRRADADYLMYALIDLVIDQGFPILETMGEWLDELEGELINEGARVSAGDLHHIRRDLLLLRRYLWPHREILSNLGREGHDLINESTLVYLRDCQDHSVQIIELLESYREIAASLLEIHLSALSHRLNESMRVLTIIATVFIPPTFIVGVYGMNFDPSAGPWSMPELSWPLGYLFVWGSILAIMTALLLWIRRRGL